MPFGDIFGSDLPGVTPGPSPEVTPGPFPELAPGHALGGGGGIIFGGGGGGFFVSPLALDDLLFAPVSILVSGLYFCGRSWPGIGVGMQKHANATGELLAVAKNGLRLSQNYRLHYFYLFLICLGDFYGFGRRGFGLFLNPPPNMPI